MTVKELIETNRRPHMSKFDEILTVCRTLNEDGMAR